MSAIPGINMSHQIISEDCRTNHGGLDAFDIAVERIRERYGESLRQRGEPNAANYHLVLSVEEPQQGTP